MTKDVNSELDHIKNVVETIEKKVDLNLKKISEVEGNIENKISEVHSELNNINKLMVSNEDKNFNYLTEINTVTLFELKTSLKNQIIRSSENTESGLVALISNLENIINTNMSVYNKTEIKLLKQIKALVDQKEN